MLQFTTINHLARKKLGLSMNDYCLADMIYHLSTNPDAPVKGWCNMSRTRMARELELGRRTVFNMIDRLIELKILKKHKKEGYLKTTAIWYQTVIVQKVHRKTNLDGAESAPPLVQKVHRTGAESAPYINTYINNDNIHSHSEKNVFDLIKEKINSTPENQKDVWKMKYAVNVQTLNSLVDTFAPWWVARNGQGLDDVSLEGLITRTGAKTFQAAFESSFLRNQKKQTTPGRPTPGPNAKRMDFKYLKNVKL